MTDINVAVRLGLAAAAVMLKAAACNGPTGKPVPVQKRVTLYSKPGKKPMPQPAYAKQAANVRNAANTFSMLMAGQEMNDNDSVKPRQTVTAKKERARGPVRAAVPLRTRQNPAAMKRRRQR
jgi:hypothetical protein